MKPVMLAGIFLLSLCSWANAQQDDIESWIYYAWEECFPDPVRHSEDVALCSDQLLHGNSMKHWRGSTDLS